MLQVQATGTHVPRLYPGVSTPDDETIESEEEDGRNRNRQLYSNLVAEMDEEERKNSEIAWMIWDWVFKEESCTDVSVSFSRYYSVVSSTDANEIVLPTTILLSEENVEPQPFWIAEPEECS